jgi:undecaprenyl-diphosphatase
VSSVVFIALAIMARSIGYFPIDLRITRAVQAIPFGTFHQLMAGLTWLGYMPQVVILGLIAVAILFVTGLRWEAVMTFIAGAVAGAGMIAKQIVFRPRPPAALVHVVRQLASPSFPSGHVLVFTAFCGFLAFLVYTLLKPSWFRTVLLVVLCLIIGLMGPSRIDMGAHWFSDVAGGYLLGGLWLALTVRLYRWGKPRFFVHQPVAPESSTARGAATTPRHSG